MGRCVGCEEYCASAVAITCSCPVGAYRFRTPRSYALVLQYVWLLIRGLFVGDAVRDAFETRHL